MADSKRDRFEFLQGTLDMLILRTLIFGPLHGYGIAQSIHHSSGEALRVEAGSLYPALQRLELKGLVTAKWEKSESNRRARYYALTPAGRKRLASDMSRWRDFSIAIARVLDPNPSEG
jgi:PadR family transcriptional regulator, regulatory protein PadR